MTTRRGKALRTAALSNAGPLCLYFPIDIQQLVLDELSNLEDAANAVDAFRWQQPDDCWRRRLPLDTIPESDAVVSDNISIDWRRFFIEYGRLVAGSTQALASRVRIFTMLQAIRDQFFEIVKETDGTYAKKKTAL